MPKSPNRYSQILSHIFDAHWRGGVLEFVFERQEIETAARTLGIELPKNLGDLTYSFRYRSKMPENVLSSEPIGREWIIEGAGPAKYRFRLVKISRVVPRGDLVKIDIPDATPEIIRGYALDDEQALLAIVRYNRLIDTFLGLTTYSLQNHLRTTVKGIGQIEIDELYVGIDKHGCNYVIPVQAKGGKDQIGVVQTTQDIRYVEEKFPGFRCRAIATQFMDGGTVALFELTVQEGEVRVVDERHYRLRPWTEIDRIAMQKYPVL